MKYEIFVLLRSNRALILTAVDWLLFAEDGDDGSGTVEHDRYQGRQVDTKANPV